MSRRTARRKLTGLAAVAALTTLCMAPAHAVAGHGPGHLPTQTAMDAQVAAGAIGVLGQADDSRGSWKGTSGVADLSTGRPLTASDRFRIGSISKTFVATVVLQLESERKLSLDDTVERWLPGLIQGNGNDGSKITIRALLNSTSGIFDYTSDPEFGARIFGPGFLEHRYDTYTPTELIGYALKHQPDFPSGTSWHYSNTNYIVAGMIIQKVTGHSYATEIERRIIRPLGLRGTSLPGTSPTLPQPHAQAYSTLGNPAADATVYDVTELNASLAGAAADMISTVGDINRFYQALLRGRLLSHGQLNKMLTTVPTDPAGPDPDGYGLGISPQVLPCGITVWGANGGIHGQKSLVGAARNGSHVASFTITDDWKGDLYALVQAEFCGTAPHSGGAAPADDRAGGGA